MSAAEPYEQLARLAERELALVTASDLPSLDDLDALLTERDALVASLPAQAPPDAAPALARAMALQERITAELTTRASAVRRQLGDVERGRRTAHGYGAARSRRGTLDLAG